MTNTVQTLQGNTPEERAKKGWNAIYSMLMLAAFGCCLLLGVIPQYESYLSLILLMCAVASFFGDYYYLYLALYMFVRHRTTISIYPSFEFYAYLLILKLMLDFGKIRLRTFYLPILMIFLLHTLFAGTSVELGTALKLAVYLVAVYGTLSKVLADDELMRKFCIVFLLGTIVSGVYGYTAGDTVKDIRVAGGGAYEVSRNFGILYDANFASLFYNAAIFIALFLKGIPKLVKLLLTGFSFVLLLQTSSLSGMLTFVICCVFAVILKFRKKSIPILLGGVILAAIVLSIPQVQQIKAVSDLLLRLAERLHYIKIGRWDLITTGRTELWEYSLQLFREKSLLGKLFGGSVITVNLVGTSIKVFFTSCHQSIVQSVLDFGIIGTLVIYLSLGGAFLYRTLRHLCRGAVYENEDIKIIQLMMSCVYIVMSMTIDTFVDWASMLFLFI